MNTETPDRFFDLAMKKIAGQASDAELTELDGLIAADVALQDEYNRLAAESQLLKEALPLAAATQATEGEFPGWALANLQLEVRETFGRPNKEQGQRTELTDWEGQLISATAIPQPPAPAIPQPPAPASAQPPAPASAQPFRFGWGWGLGLAAILLVCIMPVGMWTLLSTGLASAKYKANAVKSVSNVKILNKCAVFYAEENKGSLPNADVWCDMLYEEAGSPMIFASPQNPEAMRLGRGESGESKKVSSYTFNRALAGKETSKFPPLTVMFYETTHLQWNRTGGIEDLNDPQHFPEKIAVSFIDGSARQMTLKELKSQHWGNDGN